MVLTISIDASGFCKRTCFVFGQDWEINKLYNSMEAALRKIGYSGPLHWKKISKRKKQKIKNDLRRLVKESTIKFFIFKHKRPRERKKKEFYMKFIPNRIAYFFERELVGKTGNLFVTSDRDFDKIKGNGTELFLRSFMKSLGSRIGNTEITVKKRKNLVARVYYHGGSYLQIIGKKDGEHHHGVCIADLILGLTKGFNGMDRVIIIDLLRKVEGDNTPSSKRRG